MSEQEPDPYRAWHTTTIEVGGPRKELFDWCSQVLHHEYGVDVSRWGEIPRTSFAVAVGLVTETVVEQSTAAVDLGRKLGEMIDEAYIHYAKMWGYPEIPPFYQAKLAFLVLYSHVLTVKDCSESVIDTIKTLKS